MIDCINYYAQIVDRTDDFNNCDDFSDPSKLWYTQSITRLCILSFDCGFLSLSARNFSRLISFVKGEKWVAQTGCCSSGWPNRESGVQLQISLFVHYSRRALSRCDGISDLREFIVICSSDRPNAVLVALGPTLGIDLPQHKAQHIFNLHPVSGLPFSGFSAAQVESRCPIYYIAVQCGISFVKYFICSICVVLSILEILNPSDKNVLVTFSSNSNNILV